MSGPKIKLLRQVTDDEKLAPQQKIIYDALLKYGVGKEVDRETVVKDIEKAGELKTKQDVGRVVVYYMQDFAKKKLAETIKAEPAPKPEKTEKKGEPSKPGTKSPADSSEKKPDKAAA